MLWRSRMARSSTNTAGPAPSRVIHPSLTAVRWLLPDDENALVIDSDVLKSEYGGARLGQCSS